MHRNVGYAKKTSFNTALSRVDHVRMIGPSMLRQLFPDSRIEKERFALLTKSIIAIRDYMPD